MDRLRTLSSHRATHRRRTTPYVVLIVVSVLALLLLAAALLPATANAAAQSLCRFCPPEPPPPEPSVARPRALAAAKDLNGGDLTPGDEILWTITVKNVGAVTLNDITVTNLVPEWTSYVAGSIEGTGADDSSGSSLTWAVGTLKCGERLTLSFRSRVDDDAPAGTVIVNQASTDSAETPPSTSKEVSLVVVGSAGASSLVGSLSSSPTTVPEAAAADAGSAEAPDPTEAADEETLASSEATSPSSPSPTELAAAGDSPLPVAASASDDGIGRELGLGLGIGLGGLAVIGLATGLVVRRRGQAA